MSWHTNAERGKDAEFQVSIIPAVYNTLRDLWLFGWLKVDGAEPPTCCPLSPLDVWRPPWTLAGDLRPKKLWKRRHSNVPKSFLRLLINFFWDVLSKLLARTECSLHSLRSWGWIQAFQARCPAVVKRLCSHFCIVIARSFQEFFWSSRHYLWMWRWILAFQCSVCWDQRAQLACRQHCKLICQIHSVACPLPRHPYWIWNAPLVDWVFDFKFKTTFLWSFASNLSKHLVKLIYSGHGISRDCYCALEWLAA